jgi:glycosyltransferase involved in cell wall biosynthesis
MFVGSLIRRKELHTLILAAGLIPSDQLHIDVIGNPEAEPEYTRYVKTLIKDTGREGTIHLRGALSNEELHRYYRVAGLLAVPSSYEGFGIVYLEGMGFGLPAIASNTGAAHEVVTDGVNGYLPPPGDAHAIAECLRALINNRDLRIRLSLAALDRYQSHCTWDETAQNVHAFLKSLVLPS